MVRECLVILNNETVTVVKYGDINIQFPSVHKNVKTILVGCESGKYFIVDENKSTDGINTSVKRSANKKTTINEDSEEVANNTVTNIENA